MPASQPTAQGTVTTDDAGNAGDSSGNHKHGANRTRIAAAHAAAAAAAPLFSRRRTATRTRRSYDDDDDFIEFGSQGLDYKAYINIYMQYKRKLGPYTLSTFTQSTYLRPEVSTQPHSFVCVAAKTLN